MTFGIFAHGLQISFANTHWWQNLCAFVDILHAQNKHGTLFFSQNGKYFSFLGLKFYQNICADFLTLARGGGGSIYLGWVCVNFSVILLLDFQNQSDETLLSRNWVRGVRSRLKGSL